MFRILGEQNGYCVVEASEDEVMTLCTKYFPLAKFSVKPVIPIDVSIEERPVGVDRGSRESPEAGAARPPGTRGTPQKAGAA